LCSSAIQGDPIQLLLLILRKKNPRSTTAAQQQEPISRISSSAKFPLMTHARSPALVPAAVALTNV